MLDIRASDRTRVWSWLLLAFERVLSNEVVKRFNPTNNFLKTGNVYFIIAGLRFYFVSLIVILYFYEYIFLVGNLFRLSISMTSIPFLLSYVILHIMCILCIFAL